MYCHCFKTIFAGGKINWHHGYKQNFKNNIINETSKPVNWCLQWTVPDSTKQMTGPNTQ